MDGGVVFGVGGGFIGGENKNVAGEAVAEGVETATGFAFGGAGAGGARGGDGFGNRLSSHVSPSRFEIYQGGCAATGLSEG